MKKLIFKLFAYFMILTSLCLGFGLFVIQGLPAQFQRSYQSAIVDQYDRFVQTTSPKIIFLAGSSGAFGLDIDRMEQALDIPVTSLALHAGFGNRFPMELSKANIQSGDIIVLAFEYQVYNDEDRFGSELVATALDHRIDMYRALSFDDMVQIVRYFPKFLFKKVDSLMQNPDGVPAAGVYARSAFNEHGNMIFRRPKCVLPNAPLSPESYTVSHLQASHIRQDAIDTLNAYISYAQERGAHVVVSFPPCLDELIVGSKADIEGYQQALKERLHAPVISNIFDYIYPREYIYDAAYHCTDEGTQKRTEQLIQDLKNYLEQ